MLTNGAVIEARLLVVATGYSEAIRRALGIERVELSKAHSLSIGFDLAMSASAVATAAAHCARALGLTSVRRIPMVVLSGSDGASQTLGERGVEGVLQKPVSTSRLLGTVQRYCA